MSVNPISNPNQILLNRLGQYEFGLCVFSIHSGKVVPILRRNPLIPEVMDVAVFGDCDQEAVPVKVDPTGFALLTDEFLHDQFWLLRHILDHLVKAASVIVVQRDLLRIEAFIIDPTPDYLGVESLCHNLLWTRFCGFEAVF